MRVEQRKAIADAILYEGYLLYPYRRSAIKNRQRWTFGVVYPKEFSIANGGTETCTMRTECLVTTEENKDATVDIYVRFLHLLSVRRGNVEGGQDQLSHHPTMDRKPRDIADADAFNTWEEGIEREVSALKLPLYELLAHPQRLEISFPDTSITEEAARDAQGIVREQKTLAGNVIISAKQVRDNHFRLNVQIENNTPDTGTITCRGDRIVLQSFVSTHTLLQVYQGAFISLLEPPEGLENAARECQNLHTWPVLIGDEGEHDGILSSPIILYDYPQIAPESPGPLFDGTEIDEILTLRIMTLTDEEKREMREGDARAREILERTENMSPEQFMKLHGVIRNMRPVEEEDNA